MHGNIDQLLCVDDIFSEVLVFDDPVIASEVQQVICGAISTSDIFNYFKGSLNVTELVHLVSVFFLHGGKC